MQARENPGRSDKDRVPKRSRFRSAGNRMGEHSLNFSLKFTLIEGRLLNLPLRPPNGPETGPIILPGLLRKEPQAPVQVLGEMMIFVFLMHTFFLSSND